MTETAVPQNIVITVAAGYREEQIRPFLASLCHYSPGASLRLIVDRVNPEFQADIRAWFPTASFYLLPPKPLRDFALKRKWARSLLKRLSKWSGSPGLGQRLLKINYLRHLVIRDLLDDWNLERDKILLCDSRDLVFQGDPFAGEWPLLWSCEEDRRIEECGFNSFCLERAGGSAALQAAKHERIVCAGLIGGRADRIRAYLKESSKVVELLAPKIPLTDGDQGIHNYLVRTRPELGCVALPNGCRLGANLGYTPMADLALEDGQVHFRNRDEIPAVLHQYDRHPELKALFQEMWGGTKASSSI